MKILQQQITLYVNINRYSEKHELTQLEEICIFLRYNLYKSSHCTNKKTQYNYDSGLYILDSSLQEVGKLSFVLYKIYND